MHELRRATGRSDVVSPPAAAVSLIEGAKVLPHRRTSLFDHLVGTWRILVSVGAPDRVARAGLVHSVYATEHYHLEFLKRHERGRVRAAVGYKAERLSFYFGSLKKSDLWDEMQNSRTQNVFRVPDMNGRCRSIKRGDAEDLLKIECANVVEQCSAADFFPKPFMAWYLNLARKGLVDFRCEDTKSLPLLSEDDERAGIELYRTYFESRLEIGPNLVRQLSRKNPLAGEVWLLSAVAAAEQGDVREAEDNIRKSESMFLAWGTSWDKRLSFDGWMGLVQLLKENSSSRTYAQVIEYVRDRSAMEINRSFAV